MLYSVYPSGIAAGDGDLPLFVGHRDDVIAFVTERTRRPGWAFLLTPKYLRPNGKVWVAPRDGGNGALVVETPDADRYCAFCQCYMAPDEPGEIHPYCEAA